MKGKMTISIHPYLFNRFREIIGSRQMSQTLENILRQYNTDKICETQKYKQSNYQTQSSFSIDIEVLDEFVKSMDRFDKKSTIIGLLIKQYLERLNEL